MGHVEGLSIRTENTDSVIPGVEMNVYHFEKKHRGDEFFVQFDDRDPADEQWIRARSLRRRK